MQAITLAYHDVSSDELPRGAARERSAYTVSRRDFRRHLERIAERSTPGVVSTLRLSRIETDGVPRLLTFDDGALCAYGSIAEELERRGWIGHFFITTDWLGRPGFLNEALVRELHLRGHVIGSHSRTHPERMAHLDFARIVEEWSDSCARLAQILGRAVRVASVPGGYYSTKVARAAAAAGIQVLFTSEPTTQVAEINGCLVLGRYTIRRSTPLAAVEALAAGAGWPRWWQAASWSVKGFIKRIAGPYYPAARQVWARLSKRPSGTA